MTTAGFWKDDAQVFREINEKYYSFREGIYVEVVGGDPRVHVLGG